MVEVRCAFPKNDQSPRVSFQIEGFSNTFKDKQQMAQKATMMYGVSMFHCLPVGSNSKGRFFPVCIQFCQFYKLLLLLKMTYYVSVVRPSILPCIDTNNVSDALRLGAMWGKERALKMLKESGFSNVRVVPTPYFEIGILYVCTKD